jgi:hypothetical protein
MGILRGFLFRTESSQLSQKKNYLQIHLLTDFILMHLKLHAFLLIRIVGSEVQLGPLGTSATNCPFVPALGDYENG